MKIDCPHCGVHGSVDDSLAGKKLRCPKCSKVFLITEDVLPEIDDTGVVHQEILYDNESEQTEVVQQESVQPEETVETEDITEPEEELLADEEEVAAESEELEKSVAELEEPEESEEIEELAEAPVEDDPALLECSVCKQSFAAEFMVEIDSKLYCALCQPDSDEEELEFSDTKEDGEDLDDDLLAFMGEDSSDDGKNDSSDEEEEFLLMGDASEDEPEEEDGATLALMADDDDDDDDESVELQVCSGCGESLHPDFLEQIGSKHYCALCVPEDVISSDDEAEGLEFGETEDVAEVEETAAFDEEVREETDAPVQALVSETEEDDEEGYPKEPCSVCGERFHRDFMQEVDSKLYCGVCQPEVIEVLSDTDMAVTAGAEVVSGNDDEEYEEPSEGGDDFTIGELIKEAWQKTKGAKASVWAALIVMYVIILSISFGGMSAFQAFYKGTDPVTTMGVNGALQLVSSWLSMLMTGGIMLIGVRRAMEQRVSWKMVFAGFSKALSVTIALVLQSILIVIGFILLVLPGIYLTVGYALTLPLILDKGMGPWEALEASRKAIHKKWWSVLGLYLVMMLVAMVASIPLGLGLIWIIPMYFVLLGVLYVRLFGAGEAVDDDLEDDFVDDEDEELFDDESRELFDDESKDMAESTVEEEQEELFEESKERQ